MRRKTASIIVGASLLALLASGILWIRSYWRSDQIERKLVINHAANGFGGYEIWDTIVSTNYGGIRFVREHDQNVWFANSWPTTFSSSALESWDNEYPYWMSSSPDEKFRAMGFQYLVHDWSDTDGAKKHNVNFVMPFASLTILFGIAPAAWLVTRLRFRRRSVRGVCKCGYDLRASIDRCPECGRSITRGDRATA